MDGPQRGCEGGGSRGMRPPRLANRDFCQSTAGGRGAHAAQCIHIHIQYMCIPAGMFRHADRDTAREERPPNAGETTCALHNATGVVIGDDGAVFLARALSSPSSLPRHCACHTNHAGAPWGRECRGQQVGGGGSGVYLSRGRGARLGDPLPWWSRPLTDPPRAAVCPTTGRPHSDAPPPREAVCPGAHSPTRLTPS